MPTLVKMLFTAEGLSIENYVFSEIEWMSPFGSIIFSGCDGSIVKKQCIIDREVVLIEDEKD